MSPSYQGRSWYYAPSLARGTRRFQRIRRRKKHNAIYCDAMCDAHSGRGDRRHARVTRDRAAAREIATGIEVHAIERSDDCIACIVPL